MKEVSMEYEEWRVIPNSEDKYFASNYGRIFSVRQKKVMKQFKNNHGRLRVEIKANGERHTRLVNVLVIEAFQGVYDKNIYEVHHKDCNFLNNNLDNLQLLTKSEHRKIHKQIEANRKGDEQSNETSML